MGSLGRGMVEMVGTMERRMVEMVNGMDRGELVVGLLAMMLVTIMIRKGKHRPGCSCYYPVTSLTVTERGWGKKVGFWASCCVTLH